jgi:hypothetical protein
MARETGRRPNRFLFSERRHADGVICWRFLCQLSRRANQSLFSGTEKPLGPVWKTVLQRHFPSAEKPYYTASTKNRTTSIFRDYPLLGADLVLVGLRCCAWAGGHGRAGTKDLYRPSVFVTAFPLFSGARFPLPVSGGLRSTGGVSKRTSQGRQHSGFWRRGTRERCGQLHPCS